ncbi:alkylhydroperoxidase AhpD family core domain-containing protein [Paenibacillus sp. cl141a]|uniref:carboxymuconolactone decarboxylase family protein n=1 Tax=Paenibacillus sp. cl141a TaxID=1761877 RepID=UPI0008AF50D2|nr:carboxymuconolactone decarboxylase family protein [Paenibacillus sp. cl141a]SEL52142.1 alkylhydroperoxidase AhpD family core domain-containing protein [Paenibacillus sp. cl141a]
MELRMNYRSANPEAFKTLLALEQAAQKSGLDHKLYEIIKLRASQINGCSFCVDMHSKDLLSMGESVDRLLLLPMWREVPIYSDEERAVIELTECVTKLTEAGVPAEVYERVRKHFDEKQFVDLVMAITTINAWNRIGVATGLFPGCFD